MGKMLRDGETRLQLTALHCMEKLRRHTEVSDRVEEILDSFDPTRYADSEVLAYMKRRAMGCRLDTLDEEGASRIYLSNLKSAVHWTVKMTQIDMLCDHVRSHPETALHTAMHLSNVLSVSEHFPVRQSAGKHLLQIAPYLSVDHINEITIDLLRELETGQNEISYVIPPYLGRLMCMLPEKEMWEAETFLEDLVHGSAVRPARVAPERGHRPHADGDGETRLRSRLGYRTEWICQKTAPIRVEIKTNPFHRSGHRQRTDCQNRQ
jgi:hypothetical protein